MTALKDVTALVASELQLVNAIVDEALRPQAAELVPLVGHVGGFRGKQLRASLVLLTGKALGRHTRPELAAHLQVAAIIEMIHAATLVHDDILDGALVRRSMPTLNAVNGSEVSVLLGDYIYAKAFHMSVSLPDQRCSRTLAEVTRLICQGEITQMLHRYDADLSEAQYLQIIGEKTALLYGAASELGAAYAGADERRVRACRDFGFNLGLAFQVVDDCLDVEGDEAVVGKSLGTDFGRGKLTLPLLWILRGLDPVRRRRFQEIFELRPDGNGALLAKQKALAAEFDLAGGLAYAHERAAGYLKVATSCLADFPDNEHAEALRAMADFVLQRRS